MATIIQKIQTRTVIGKKVKTLRRSGITPANIYRAGFESLAVQGDTTLMEKTLSKAGKTQLVTLQNPDDSDRQVLIKKIQRDPLSRQLLHIDFHQVSLKDKVKIAVPLIFEGEARASRRSDLLVLENINAIDVECLPAEIPENITVDISELTEAGDRLTVEDLVIDEKIAILNDPEDILISVSYAKAEEEFGEEEEGEAAEAETEAGAGDTASAEASSDEPES
jgi:large subunit ribosomal protein L25